jgi:hypothetical protein
MLAPVRTKPLSSSLTPERSALEPCEDSLFTFSMPTPCDVIPIFSIGYSVALGDFDNDFVTYLTLRSHDILIIMSKLFKVNQLQVARTPHSNPDTMALHRARIATDAGRLSCVKAIAAWGSSWPG